MLDDVVGILRCPHCAGPLTRAGSSLRCGDGHSFDVARQGYVNLLAGDARAGTGDTATMVAARDAFLGRGHYRRIAEEVGDAVAGVAEDPGSIVEIGAGTGYFLATALDRLSVDGRRAGLALDASKYAARRAARAHPRIGAAVCDAWAPLPVRSGTAAVVLVVLAPRNGAEIRRLLRSSGGLVLVTPTRRHLGELVGPVGLLTVDERKRERVAAQLEPHLELAGQHVCEHAMRLTREDVRHLVAMGPSARHATARSLGERIGRLPEPATVTASFSVAVYRPGSAG